MKIPLNHPRDKNESHICCKTRLHHFRSGLSARQRNDEHFPTDQRRQNRFANRGFGDSAIRGNGQRLHSQPPTSWGYRDCVACCPSPDGVATFAVNLRSTCLNPRRSSSSATAVAMRATSFSRAVMRRSLFRRKRQAVPALKTFANRRECLAISSSSPRRRMCRKERLLHECRPLCR